MAITATQSNHYKFQLGAKQIDLANDTIKPILMDNTFSFDPDAHATLSDVTDHQLATKNGYTQNNYTFSTPVWAENDSTNQAEFTCDNETIMATAADDETGIGPTGGYVIYDASAIEATEFFTTEIDRTFTGGATHWANGDVGTTFDETTDLSLVASAIGQYCKITFTDIGTALVAGGLYRLQYDYSETTAGWEFKLNGVALKTLGDAVAGTAQTIDFYADESFTGAHELRIYSKTNAAAAGDFDNFSLKELGTIISGIDYGTDYTISSGSSIQLQNVAVSII